MSDSCSPARSSLRGKGRRWRPGTCSQRGELAQLRGFPEPARAEMIRYFTLGSADEAFVRKFRGQDNVLGVAVQLCTLPWLGVVPDDVAPGPAAVGARLSGKLGGPRRAPRG